MRHSAAELHAITEVQTNFHWEADFSGAGMSDFQDPLSIRMTSANLPTPEIKNLEVETHGYNFPEPGMVAYNGSITLVAFETVGAELIKPFYEWVNKIYNFNPSDVTGKQDVAHQQLFGKVDLTLKDKQEAKTTQTYSLFKCIVSEWNPGADLGSGSEPEYFKPELTVDFAWFTHVV